MPFTVLAPSTPLETEATKTDLRRIAMQVGQSPKAIEGQYDIIRLGELRFACPKLEGSVSEGVSAPSSAVKSSLGKTVSRNVDASAGLKASQKAGDKPEELQGKLKSQEEVPEVSYASNILRRRDRRMELTDPKHALYPWEAGLYLCEFIRENTELAFGRRVINIEAGIGLAGLACSRVGSDSVTLTDSNDEAVSLMLANRGLNPWLKNTEKMHILQFDFTDIERAKLIAQEIGPYDLLIASDVLYSDQSVIATVNCLENLVKTTFSKDILLQNEWFRNKNIDLAALDSVDFSFRGLLTHEICFRQGETKDGHLWDFLHLLRDKKWKWRIYLLEKSESVFTIHDVSLADRASHLIKTMPSKKARSTTGESSQAALGTDLHIHVDKDKTPSLERPDTGTPIVTEDVATEGGKRGRVLESELPEAVPAPGVGEMGHGMGTQGQSEASGPSGVIDLTKGKEPPNLWLSKPAATVEKHIVTETLCVPLGRKEVGDDQQFSSGTAGMRMAQDESETVSTPTAATQTTQQGINIVPKAFFDASAKCCNDNGNCFHRLDSLQEGDVILIKLYKVTA